MSQKVFTSALVSLPSWSRCPCQTAGLKTSLWPTCTQSCRWSKKRCRNTRTSLRLAFRRAPTSSLRLPLLTITSEVCFIYFQWKCCLSKECYRDSFSLTALCCFFYFILDIDQALALFNELRDQDPYRIDNMDTFSNLLYVKVSVTLLMWCFIDLHSRDVFNLVPPVWQYES